MHKVVAIDGPSGAGKSTAARMLSERLGFRYLDTGALYRAAALALRRIGLCEDATDEEIREALKEVEIKFTDGRVYIGDEDVSGEIRSTEMGHYSSVFSARRPVRDFLLPIQRASAESMDLVAEGRDMTTVVFPGASWKFFLDASTEVRAGRRYRQLVDKGVDVTLEDAFKDVAGRDMRDSERDISPLKVDESATYIDTSGLTADEVVAMMAAETERGGGEGAE